MADLICSELGFEWGEYIQMDGSKADRKVSVMVTGESGACDGSESRLS